MPEKQNVGSGLHLSAPLIACACSVRVSVDTCLTVSLFLLFSGYSKVSRFEIRRSYAARTVHVSDENSTQPGNEDTHSRTCTVASNFKKRQVAGHMRTRRAAG